MSNSDKPSSSNKNPVNSSSSITNVDDPNFVPDQSIGSDVVISNTVKGEEQTVFTPISLADAQKNAKKHMDSTSATFSISNIDSVNSAIYNTDDYRLAKLIEKALKGENLTIATLGGSITNGGGAGGAQYRYVTRIHEWFKATFPNIKVTLINAGIGATTSAFGIYRLKEDVLIYDPDLIVIDYAANDGTRAHLTETYEGLLRCALNYKETAVVPIYFSNKAKASAQKTEKTTADHYKLPQVSYMDAFKDYSDWANMYADGTHPNALGHGRAAFAFNQLMTTALNNYNSAKKSYSIPEPIISSCLNYGKDTLVKLQYQNGEVSFLKNQVVNNKTEDVPLTGKITFDNKNYTLKKDNHALVHHNFDIIKVAKGKTLKFTIKDIKTFLIIMARDADQGSNIEVVVTENDTKKKTTTTIDCYYKKLNIWDSGALYKTSDGKPHSVTVELTPIDADFSFAGLGISE